MPLKMVFRTHINDKTTHRQKSIASLFVRLRRTTENNNPSLHRRFYRQMPITPHKGGSLCFDSVTNFRAFHVFNQKQGPKIEHGKAAKNNKSERSFVWGRHNLGGCFIEPWVFRWKWKLCYRCFCSCKPIISSGRTLWSSLVITMTCATPRRKCQSHHQVKGEKGWKKPPPKKRLVTNNDVAHKGTTTTHLFHPFYFPQGKDVIG